MENFIQELVTEKVNKEVRDFDFKVVVLLMMSRIPVSIIDKIESIPKISGKLRV